MKHLPDDTIAAIATPIGEGALSIIRVSGPQALEISDSVFRGRRQLASSNGFTVHHGRIFDAEGHTIDDVLATVFRMPHSYTGENSAEISCHGGLLVTHRVLDAIIAAGARRAEPGEFTRRAFLNGRMDLSQAEAVADLIAARSSRAHTISLEQLSGRLAGRLGEIRTSLLDLCSLLEIELDFSEEGIDIVSREEVQQRIERSLEILDNMCSTYRAGRVFREGVSVVLAGRPNSGKSSLFNALLSEDRAIVTHIPGTTRDSLEESISLRGILFRLTDTAGLRTSSDIVESAGISRTLSRVQSADIVILLVDATEEYRPEEILADLGQIKGSQHILVALNKSDILDRKPEAVKWPDGLEPVLISAMTHAGLEELKSRLLSMIPGSRSVSEDSVLITNQRHVEALRRASRSLSIALESTRSGDTNEFVAFDIREAMDSLAEITGEITSEEILDSIFSRFCIGK